jgi:hypothetical protein
MAITMSVATPAVGRPDDLRQRARAVEVEIRIQPQPVEVVDFFCMLRADVAEAQVLAHNGSGPCLYQTVVAAAVGTRFALLDEARNRVVDELACRCRNENRG